MITAVSPFHSHQALTLHQQYALAQTASSIVITEVARALIASHLVATSQKAFSHTVNVPTKKTCEGLPSVAHPYPSAEKIRSDSIHREPLTRAPDLLTTYQNSLASIEEMDVESEKVDMALIEQAQKEERAHRKEQQKLDEKEADARASAERWSVATQAMVWTGTCMSTITGIGLIYAGVFLAGTLMAASGAIMLVSSILDVTGGWEKIAKWLPSENKEKRDSVLLWMRISVMALAILLTGASFLSAGTELFSAASQLMMKISNSVILGAVSICYLGDGIRKYQLSDARANKTDEEIRLAKVRHRRTNSEEQFHETMQSQETTATALRFCLNHEQAANRTITNILS